MKYDCGTTSEDPRSSRRFLALHRGWRNGQLGYDLLNELLILAATPGIPTEWLYAVFSWTPTWRRRFNHLTRGLKSEGFQDATRENAGSVRPGDGLRMIRLAGPSYAGAAPLWTQLDLQHDRRSDKAIAADLEVDRLKVRRWRLNPIFDPLTFARLRPNRGTPIAPAEVKYSSKIIAR